MKIFEGSKTIIATLVALIVLPLLDLAMKWDFQTWLTSKLCSIEGLADTCTAIAENGATIYMSVVGAVIIYLRSLSTGSAFSGVKEVVTAKKETKE